MSVSKTQRWNDRLRQERTLRNWRQQDLADQLGTTVLTVQRWERGSHHPSAYFRVKLCALFEMSAEEFGFVPCISSPPSANAGAQEVTAPPRLSHSPPQTPAGSPEPVFWSVPLPRNPFFTGREEILQMLYDGLRSQQAVALSPSYALQGLGGVGKTQIALEYAYRYALDYRAVFWIGAETEEQMLSSLLRIAAVLQVPGREDQDVLQVIAAVQRWFSTHQQWLVICDNVDDPALLHHFLPPTPQGALLLTTQCPALGPLALGLDVLPLGREEGRLLLLRRVNRLAPLATAEQVRQVAERLPAESEAIEELVTVLGGLPLALDQAGAYLQETGCSFVAYLQHYQQQRASLLSRRGVSAGLHPHSVATTFQLSMEQVRRLQPAATDFLQVCALLQAEAIPEELFLEGAAQLGAQLEALRAAPLSLDQIIAVLRRFSLIERQAVARTLSLHRLVQAVLLDTMTAAERRQWSRRVIEALDAVFPEVQTAMEQATWVHCERLLPHALFCLHQEPEVESSLACASLASKAAQYLRERGRHKEAEPLYQQALAARERLLGEAHPEVASTLSPLAILSLTLGKEGQTRAFLQVSRELRMLLTQPLPAMENTHTIIQNRANMLIKLQRLYDELLDDNLQRLAWIDVPLASLPGAVHTTANLLLRRNNLLAQLLPPGTTVQRVYRQANQELLILGDPGAGKSTLLYQLGRDLLAQAQQSEQPFPVVFPLSSWSQRKLPLHEWMVEQLSSPLYEVPRWQSQQWVQNQQILPLFDGLDEMEEAARPACIAAINAYHRTFPFCPLVVCSRSQEYHTASQQEQLHLQNAIEVQPLTSRQQEEALRQAGAAMEGLRNELTSNEELSELVRTPLWLNVLLLTFRETPQPALPQERFALQHEVLRRYVQRMCERKGDATRYSVIPTTRWLGFLARQMRQRNQTVFTIEELQLDWLDRKFWVGYRWSVVLSIELAFGLVVGLAFGLVVGLAFGLVVGLAFGLNNKIMLVERLIWSRKGIRRGLAFGLLTGLGTGLLANLGGGLNVGLAVGLAAGLFVGLENEPPVERDTSSPGEGTHRSIKNGLLFGLTVALLTGLLVGLVDRLLPSLIIGLIAGLFVGLLFWLFVGPLTGLFTGLVNGLFFGLFGGLFVGPLGGIKDGVYSSRGRIDRPPRRL